MINERHGTQPTDWDYVPSPLGAGQWILGSSSYTLTAVVPPGTPAGLDEPFDDQIFWRQLVWAVDDLGRPWETASRQIIAVPDVVKLLPERERSSIRSACARQLQQLELWSAAPTGHGHDQRAHDVTRLRDELRRECRLAFPGELWHVSDEPEVPPIPTTADALLHRIDFPDPARAEEVWNQIQSYLERGFYGAVNVYRWLLVQRRWLRRKYDEWLQGSGRETTDRASAEQADEHHDADQHELLTH